MYVVSTGTFLFSDFDFGFFLTSNPPTHTLMTRVGSFNVIVN